ncbi:YqhA family protein [Microseira wollei]|uniref:YqhA family protein n=1 Tax=Microseira wollei NIES-4236 TaxID=2530354 RepID=A0AAV3XLX8_9CYAN|nr:YqhA family protein [Microseira wollei]GET42651.1 hypothetical protein MiSe_74690 [Microseira wollei NIES-4236]
MRRQAKLEKIAEYLLWNVRFITLVPIFFGICSVFTLIFLGSLEIVHGMQAYFHFQEDEAKYSAEMLSSIISGVDHYLIAIVLLLFSFGIYELFISKIDIGRANQDLRILEIRTLEQLKDKILKVIVMVLVVSFFKAVLEMKPTTTVDLLYLSISILLIAASSFLMTKSHYSHHSADDASHSTPKT